MKNRYILFVISLLITFIFTISCKCIDPDFKLIDDWPDETILQRTSPDTYNVTISVIITNNGLSLTKLTVIIPLPQSNPYQEISINELNDGEVRVIKDSSDKYVRFIKTSGLPTIEESITFSISFQVTLYDIKADFNAITIENPYNIESDIYKNYLGKSGNIVDPENETIKNIGDNLWKNSSGIVDYAHKCYQYIIDNYQYKNPGVGFQPLSQVLEEGGGDCGNLSSIFVSLLRYKNIPCRHLLAMRIGESPHVWADFYLEGYGWIPVDVSAALVSQQDFFGIQPISNTGIIMTKDVNQTIYYGDGVYYAPGLQSFLYWYWGSGLGSLSYSYQIKKD